MNARISARAGDDLDTIFAWISALQGPAAAEHFLEVVKDAVSFLVQNPNASPHPKWISRHKALRFWVISKTNFLIFYFVEEDGVSIERITGWAPGCKADYRATSRRAPGLILCEISGLEENAVDGATQ